MNKEEALQASDTALQELATALRQGKSDSLLHYLSMLSRFHRYSFSNCMLISLQKPDATLVAGFQRWKSLGRFVKRNERGIALLAPMISRSKTESADEADSAESTVRVLRGFRVVHVFDVSQTEGRELASFASLAGDPGDWLPRLEGLVASHGIRLEYPEVVLQNANGASFGGLIHVSSRLPMAQTVTTPYAADWIPPQTLTGAELVCWMRRFQTTIRDLAQRMGMTQRRIRECRRAGLGNPHAVRDWLEAITGHDPGPRPEVASVQRWELPLTCRCGRRLLLGDGVWRVYRHSWCSMDCFLIDRPELFRQSR